MNSHEIRVELEKAKRKASNIRPLESWLGLFGKATVRYCYDVKPEKVLYTLKYANEELKVYDAEGKEVVNVSQDMPHAPVKKAGKPVEQPDNE